MKFCLKNWPYTLKMANFWPLLVLKILNNISKNPFNMLIRVCEKLLKFFCYTNKFPNCHQTFLQSLEGLLYPTRLMIQCSLKKERVLFYPKKRFLNLYAISHFIAIMNLLFEFWAVWWKEILRFMEKQRYL